MPTPAESFWLRRTKAELVRYLVATQEERDEQRRLRYEAEKERDEARRRAETARVWRPCPEHPEYDDPDDNVREAAETLEHWLHDTFGPLGWPKDHPVAIALTELDS